MARNLEMTKEGGGVKQGPNKILFVILGVLAAVALFMFVLQPMIFGGDDEPAEGSPEAASPGTQVEDSRPGTPSDGAAETPEAGLDPGDVVEGAAATGAGSSVEAAYAELPAEFAGNELRPDPFESLAPAKEAAPQP